MNPSDKEGSKRNLKYAQDAANRNMRRHPDKWDRSRHESCGIFESVEFLNESKYSDHIFQIAKKMSMIKYGAFDKDGNELPDKRMMDAVVQDPEDTLKRGKGFCVDQVEVERLLFTKAGIPHKVYDVGYKDDEGDDVSHVFLVFKDGKEFKWFENSWSSCKGIHSYKSLNDLFHDVAERHCGRENINNCKIAEINESLVGMTQDEMAKLVNSKTNIFSK